MQTFDDKIQDFLNKKKPGTRKIYTAGIASFEAFYSKYGSIPDFLDRLHADRDLNWRRTEHVAANVISEYVSWLKTRFKRKTVRAYVGAVQQLAKYYNLEFSTRDTQLPASNPDLKKYPWTLEELQHFFGLFDNQMYRCLGVLITQSFFDCMTSLCIEYRDIKKEYEAGVYPLCLDTERFKTEVPFLSFIGKWGIKELHVYLDNIGYIGDTTRLFPVSEQSVDAYFRVRAQVFLKRKFEKDERSPCGTHSCRASGMTFSQNSLKGDADQVRAAERYIDFFAGKTVPEQKRVYMSKSRESWRETWLTRIEPFVTPNKY